MTYKQTLINKLNDLKKAAGEAPTTEAWNKRARTWIIEALIEIYKQPA